MYVDDMAAASLFILELNQKNIKSTKPSLSHINIGTGKEITIHKLAEIIKETLVKDNCI